MPTNEGATPEADDQTTGTEDGAAASSDDSQGTSRDAEYAKLMSRIAGLDAKVTSLQGETTAQTKAREAAEQKLRDYEAGTVSADEALRAQLEAKERELEQTRREVAIAKVAQAFPETYGVFGEAVAGMSPDALAAAEARFAGTPSGEYRSPGTSSQRTSAAKSPDEMSLAELREAVNKAPSEAWANGSWSPKA